MINSKATSRDPSWRRFISVGVTGASSGIGAALARALAAPGVHLNLAGRDTARLQAVAEACRGAGATVDTDLFDVRDAHQAADWIKAADARRPLDLVIACAGITGGRKADGRDETADEALEVVRVNLLGAMHVVLPAVEAMTPRHAGHLVVVSSLSALRGMPQSPAYCGAKAGLTIWAEGLRATLRSRGLRLTVASPGFVRSPMSDQVISAKPFMIDAETAARRILTAAAKGRPRVVFPWLLLLSLKFLQLLPATWGDEALRRTPGHIAPR
ncbi:SDR family NAD(P)-dependent oxidoreductase [Pararhodospirillum oryzae]|uniref:SDR family oxidoreductase n=1 Tax=Pararhodospirillum oryzae TaxID=478448 RepID=A0A512HA29_9PROT|nr:SDR family NAD(P)-dependent oxidoreductase [Pararhodospirillum oryzae]GEO82306.1 SDR family oxidoreductase [Pararhodospirillum oryzae]